EAERLNEIPKELPLYIFAGDQDPVNNKLEALHVLLNRYQQAGLNNVSHRFYEGYRHEMLNERNRDVVTADLLQWLGANLST
ncbi:MAG: alpha/beta hydrolase, partial [Pseudomonadales bacterium]